MPSVAYIQSYFSASGMPRNPACPVHPRSNSNHGLHASVASPFQNRLAVSASDLPSMCAWESTNIGAFPCRWCGARSSVQARARVGQLVALFCRRAESRFTKAAAPSRRVHVRTGLRSHFSLAPTALPPGTRPAPACHLQATQPGSCHSTPARAVFAERDWRR